VQIIYAGAYWLTYSHAESRDLCLHEALTALFLNVMQSTISAYVIHVVIDEGFKSSPERKLLDVLKGSLGGLIVYDESNDPIFCSQKACRLMKVNGEKDMSKVLLMKIGSVQTFEQVVRLLKNDQ
jgi:hypothetical protein